MTQNNMKDIHRNELKVGDEVCYAPGGSYAGISIGVIDKFTPKQVGIRKVHGGEGRHISSDDDRLYYAYSYQLLLIK